MAKTRGNKVLNGSYAELWFNGSKIAEVQKISVKVTLERGDIQFGADMDSKLKVQKGEFTIGLKKVYTRFEDMREQLNKGIDPRFQIITKLKDPDAVGQQMERYSIDNCWLNDLPIIEYEVGNEVSQEITGGFTPSDLINLDRIKEA